MTTLGAPPSRILNTDADFDEEPAAQSVRFDDAFMYVQLTDGRELRVPLILFPRLFFATPEQRQGYQLGAFGEDIHWPELDEDILVAALLRAPEQTQYYRDELLDRLLADPQRQELYEQYRSKAIGWDAMDTPVQIPGYEELITSQGMIADIMVRIAKSITESGEYAKAKTDEMNLANVSPNRAARRQVILNELADFIRKQTSDRQKDNDLYQQITEAFVYNVDNIFTIPPNISAAHAKDLRDWRVGAEHLLQIMPENLASIERLRDSYATLVGYHPLLTNAIREARADFDRFLDNTARLEFAIKRLIKLIQARLP